MNWPIGGGRTGERIRLHDWSATPLGSLDVWPQSLKTVVDLMLGSVQPMYITWGPELTFLYNDACFPFMGDKRDTALGQPYSIVWSEIWEGELRSMIEAVMAGEAQFWHDRPFRIGGIEDQERWFTFSMNPLRDEAGLVRGALTVVIETTEKVIAEHALIESMDEGFAVMDVLFDEQGEAFDCRHVQTSPSFEAQTGLKSAVGRTMKELMPDIDAGWIKAYEKVVRTGESIRLLDHVKPLGRWFEVFMFPYGRRPSRRVGVLFRDQTEQVRAKEKLRLSEAQLGAVVEFADAAIISVDDQLRVVLFNSAAERMFDVSAQTMMGQPLDRLMPQRFRHGHPQHMLNFERGGTTLRRMMSAVELVGLRASGEEFPIEASISRAEVEGKPLLTAMIRDVSAAKALASERLARATAEEANAAKTRFLSHLSHELRTPLNAIIGFSQICMNKAEQEGVPSLADLLRHVLDAGRHQLSMIEDLLDLSRIESNQLPLHIEEVRLAEVIRECVEMVQGQADSARIQIEWASTQVCPARAPADRLRLKQVLTNLLTNAIKYNKPRGSVSVTVEETKAEVAIAVRDTGVGMSAEQLKTLFEPFARLGYETSRIEGTGIGLTISKRLMELMHGRLQVESTPDQGSTFTAALPGLSPLNHG